MRDMHVEITLYWGLRIGEDKVKLPGGPLIFDGQNMYEANSRPADNRRKHFTLSLFASMNFESSFPFVHVMCVNMELATHGPQ